MKELTIIFNYKGKEIMQETNFDKLPVQEAHFDKEAQGLFYTLECGAKEFYHISMIDFYCISSHE